MPFCMECGTPLTEKVPPGDDRPRLVCPSCSHIAYLNPKLVAGTLPVVDGKVILLRRGIEPGFGMWAYAGGFVEMGETTEECVVREAMEEVGVVVGDLKLLGVYSRPQAGVVTIVYLSELLEGEPHATPEALEVAYFAPDDIPWSELAFPTVTAALKDWTMQRTEG